MMPPRIDELSREMPDHPAVIGPHGAVWSRADLASYCNRLARALLRCGVCRGDVLLLMAPNCPEFLGVYLAAVRIGLYLVPVNWHLSISELAHIAQSSRAKVLVVHERHWDTVISGLSAAESLPRFPLCIGSRPDCRTIQEIISGENDSTITGSQFGRQLVYTSATTGVPKAVKRSLDGAAQAFESQMRAARFLIQTAGIPEGAGSSHLCQSMLYHPSPLDAVIAALFLGHSVVLMDHWTPEASLELIERHHITWTSMVPAMFVRLLKLDEVQRTRHSLASLRLVGHGSAACPTETKRRMIEWWGPVFTEVYGSSEALATTAASTAEWLRYPGTVGRPLPGVSIRILDDDGNELPPGHTGNIYIRPYTREPFEYAADPAKTRTAYRGDFLTVGDVGYLNEDGYLFICDRRIDMINTGGCKVYAAQIEGVLIQHPLVADCAAYGVPHPQLGEAVRAAVELAPDTPASPAIRADIMDFLAVHLSAEKMPIAIDFLLKLPRDPSGKLYKRMLRDPSVTQASISVCT